jgi:hypothetical protein
MKCTRLKKIKTKTSNVPAYQSKISLKHSVNKLLVPKDVFRKAKYPIDRSRVDEREGFVFCQDCHYCAAFTEGNRFVLHDGYIGYCLRSNMSMSVAYVHEERYLPFPVVTEECGCFAGKPLPKELVVASKLMGEKR